MLCPFDEPIDVREKEAYVPGMDEIIERRLNDGRAFRVVKNFIDPEALQARLREMGWAGEIRRLTPVTPMGQFGGIDWVRGEARPAEQRG